MIERTSTVRIRCPPKTKALAHTPRIYINWHTHLPFLIHYIGGQGMYMLISNAPYMNPVVRWCQSSGLKVRRGGSGQGVDSRSMMKKVLDDGHSVILAVDGPSGPIYKAKRGCVDLARETGYPIVHVHYTCKRGKNDMKRWDRMLHPAMFDDIEVIYSEPLYVPLMSVEPVEKWTKLVEERYFQNSSKEQP
jgi:lysophospholipid acyltransferase (LPLAT)-like uncharacterized protein